MKFILFTHKGKKRKSPGKTGYSFERVLFLSFVFTFCLMILVQTALTNSSVRDFLAVNTDMEGSPLEREMYLYNEGTIRIGLTGESENSDIKILVNGDEAAVFSSRILELNVKDGDVIEVDGSRFKSTAEVEILSKSDNISTPCLGKKVKVQSDTQRLLKVNIDNK